MRFSMLLLLLLGPLVARSLFHSATPYAQTPYAKTPYAKTPYAQTTSYAQTPYAKTLELLQQRKIARAAWSRDGRALWTQLRRNATAVTWTATPAPFDATLQEVLVLSHTPTTVIPARETPPLPPLLASAAVVAAAATAAATWRHSRMAPPRFAASLFRPSSAASSRATLETVAGLNYILDEEVRDLMDFIRQPERFTALGCRMPRGLLFEGPPGCGRTLLARALAVSCDVPFVASAGSDFVDMYVGKGAQNIRSLFDRARTAARQSNHKAAIVFIDEIDAVGKKEAPPSTPTPATTSATIRCCLPTIVWTPTWPTRRASRHSRVSLSKGTPRW